MDNEPESMPCTGYIGKISIVPGNKEYPDLFIAKFGTEPSVDRKKIPVKNSLYVFNGKEYEEQPTVITANSGSDSQMGQSFVWDMLQLSGIGNEQKILNIKNILQALPKPNKGNRKGAREINDHALSLIRQEQFSNAAQLLQQASQLDPSDMEIMNNLGFALLKTQQLTQAESVLIKILTYKPDRVSAWENLGHTFALKGTEDTETLALEAYLNSLLFSTDREKTVAYFAKQLEEENQPAVKSAISKAIMQAKRRYHIP
jgi:tetratricopeptide (TPR) repeat protein